MTIAERENQLHKYLEEHCPYKMVKWEQFDFAVLQKATTIYNKRGGHVHYANEVVIMADTETSKNPEHKNDTSVKMDHGRRVTVPLPYENHLVAWTVSVRMAGYNLCTLYGSDPYSNIECIEEIRKNLPGDRTYIFYHNLSYDWVFLRQFYMGQFGEPVRQLNTKPHYPISIEFDNGIILRDSLILAQRSLAKWADDLGVEHKKAVNAWDYDKIRNQGGNFTPSELTYIEHDTLSGVECIDAMRGTLKKHICTLPYTATGIVREHFRMVAKKNRGREWFLRQALDYEDVGLSEDVYHGGYTHQNRFLKNTLIDAAYTGGEPVRCWDIASSYPFALISEKYPDSKFVKYPDCRPEDIIKASENYAFMFILDLYEVKLKDPLTPMPILQYSKAKTINELCDNGRIISADFVEIAICDVDLKLIAEQYTWNAEYTKCINVRVTTKDYLPRWFTDFVYDLFRDKTMLKGGDPVLYALAKSKLNSCYGMCCQHVMQNDITEDYATGEFDTQMLQTPDAYDKYLGNKNTFLPYQIGIYCTAYAMKNLVELGACVSEDGEWIYSDTDSCFAYGWDDDKIKAYNQRRIDLMTDRGYDGIEHNGKVYHLGIVELDKVCEEFKGIHSKCYAYRDAETHKLKITVAGVPKNGAACLKDDINNFDNDFVFRGTETGKKMHTYFFMPLHKDRHGNIIGDSIDLSPCNYRVSDPNHITWTDLITDEIEIGRNYEEQ